MMDPRPPAPLDVARSEAEARSNAPVDLHAVSATLDRANRIDLEFVTPLATDYDEVFVQTYQLTRALLGDVRFNHWIGNLRATVPARGMLARFRPSRGVPIVELPALVEGLVERVRSALPGQPWSGRTPQTRVRVKRKPSVDGPSRSDIESGETAHLPFFHATVDGGRFAGERYTRHPETFAYVMAEHGDPRALHSQLDQALETRGATIGWASGTRFAYVDLALTDVSAALAVMRSVLAGTRNAKLVPLGEEGAGDAIALTDEKG